MAIGVRDGYSNTGTMYSYDELFARTGTLDIVTGIKGDDTAMASIMVTDTTDDGRQTLEFMRWEKNGGYTDQKLAPDQLVRTPVQIVGLADKRPACATSSSGAMIVASLESANVLPLIGATDNLYFSAAFDTTDGEAAGQGALPTLHRFRGCRLQGLLQPSDRSQGARAVHDHDGDRGEPVLLPVLIHTHAHRARQRVQHHDQRPHPAQARVRGHGVHRHGGASVPIDDWLRMRRIRPARAHTRHHRVIWRELPALHGARRIHARLPYTPPWMYLVLGCGLVIVVMAASVLYGLHRCRKGDIVDALRME